MDKLGIGGIVKLKDGVMYYVVADCEYNNQSYYYLTGVVGDKYKVGIVTCTQQDGRKIVSAVSDEEVMGEVVPRLRHKLGL